jgi:DNA-binding NarL/FixJ family response regulator
MPTSTSAEIGALLETDRQYVPESSAAFEAAKVQQLIREVALGAEAGESQHPVDLSILWREIVGGRVTAVDSFLSERQCFLVVKSVSESGPDCGPEARLRSRKLDVLESVLMGESQKVIALRLGTCVSTVSLVLGQALKTVGLSCCPSKVPLIVASMVAAARGLADFPSARVCELIVCGERYRIVSIVRGDLVLSSRLTRAEYATTRLLIAGKHHGEIAAERGCSVRTVANQLGSAFKKLGVSGRGELLAWLVRTGGRGGCARFAVS